MVDSIYKYYVLSTHELSHEDRFVVGFFEDMHDKISVYKQLVHVHGLDIAFVINRDKCHVRQMDRYNIVAIYKDSAELALLILLTTDGD